MVSSVSSSSFCFTFFILRVVRLCNILRSLYRRVLGYEAERILCHSLIAPRHMCNIFGLSSFQRKLHINLTTNPSVININAANCHILLSFEMAVGLTLSSFFFEESTILQSRLETCKPRSVSAFSQMYCRAIQVYGARVKIKTMRRWKVLNLDFRSPITHWITYISPYPSVSDDDYFF